MRDNLERAARHFGVTVVSEPVFGWRLRTIGAFASGSGGRYWLRVVSEFPEWAHGEMWTGNSDANTIVGIVKPRVLDVMEWDDAQWRRQRAELMTVIDGQPVAQSPDVARDPGLSEEWWSELQRSLALLRSVRTDRVWYDQALVSARTLRMLGVDVRIEAWETAHGDLHWQNLFGPELGLLDWELWGRGPAGMDAATLWLFSLRVPDVAARVHAMFADVLDSADGVRAQLVVAARLLSRIADGDFPLLATPLREHVRRLGVTIE